MPLDGRLSDRVLWFKCRTVGFFGSVRISWLHLNLLGCAFVSAHIIVTTVYDTLYTFIGMFHLYWLHNGPPFRFYTCVWEKTAGENKRFTPSLSFTVRHGIMQSKIC